MVKCPCTNCKKRGCGVYHDECKEYKDFVDGKRNERSELIHRYNFARSVMKGGKTSRKYQEKYHTGG